MTGIPDDVPLPKFEDRLWTELARIHASSDAPSSAPDTAGEPGHHGRGRSRRRRARRSLLAGVGIAATAAAVLAAVAVTGPGTGDDPTAETAASEAPEPPVSIETRIVNATDTALADSVVHVVQDMTTGPGDSEMWSDEQSGRMRSLSLDEAGAPVFDSGPAAPPALDDVGPGMPPPGTPPFDPSLPSETHRQVDYCFGEYREFDQALLPGGSEASRIRDRLADGSMIEDGTQVVDGRELIRVVSLLQPETGERAAVLETAEAATEAGGPATTDTIPANGPTTTDTIPANGPTTTDTIPANGPATTDTIPANGPTTTDAAVEEGPAVDEDHITLVDPDTYRPVMVLGYPGSDAEYVMTFEYLPRTVETLALLSPPVPEGFVATTENRGDGERFDRCGG